MIGLIVGVVVGLVLLVRRKGSNQTATPTIEISDTVLPSRLRDPETGAVDTGWLR